MTLSPPSSRVATATCADAPIVAVTSNTGPPTLRWWLVDHNVDSLTNWSDGLQSVVAVVGESPAPQIAFQLPPLTPGVLIQTVSAYFLGEQSVTPQEWEARGDFRWSVRIDANGLPGETIGESVRAPVQQLTDLITGAWVATTLNVPVPVNSGIWLVGSWGTDAADFIRLGAGNGTGAFGAWIGSDDETGHPIWNVLPSRAPLLEVKLLSNSAIDELESTAPPVFQVISRVLDGPGAPGVDTVTSIPEAIMEFADTGAVVGQTREYAVGVICDDRAPVWADAGPVMVRPRHPVAFAPEELFAAFQEGAAGEAEIRVENLTGTPLAISVRESNVLFDNGLHSGLGDSIRVIAQPQALEIAPYAMTTIGLRTVAHEASYGFFRGHIALKVAADGTTDWDNHLIPICIQLDVQTGIEAGTDGPVSTTGALHLKGVSPASGEGLRIVIERSAGVSPDGLNLSGVGQLDIAICDVLGRRRAVVTQDGADWVQTATGFRTEVVISGTGRWASGVYFCRVHWGGLSAATMIVLVK